MSEKVAQISLTFLLSSENVIRNMQLQHFKPSKHSSWWRRLEHVLKKSFVFVFRRRLHQDEYVHLSLMSSEDVFKTSSRRLGQDQYIRLGYTSSRRLQDVFKTSSRRLQDIFKAYHQVKLFLLTRLWEAFNTFLRRSFPKTINYRGICPGNTTSDKFMVSVQNLQEG